MPTNSEPRARRDRSAGRHPRIASTGRPTLRQRFARSDRSAGSVRSAERCSNGETERRVLADDQQGEPGCPSDRVNSPRARVSRRRTLTLASRQIRDDLVVVALSDVVVHHVGGSPSHPRRHRTLLGPDRPSTALSIERRPTGPADRNPPGDRAAQRASQRAASSEVCGLPGRSARRTIPSIEQHPHRLLPDGCTNRSVSLRSLP